MMRRWEYCTARYDRWADLGQLGWELAALGKDHLGRDEGFFKRPITESGRTPDDGGRDGQTVHD